MQKHYNGKHIYLEKHYKNIYPSKKWYKHNYRNQDIDNYILDTQNEIDNFYIFNLNPKGYIIVSAQKNIIPIIAFSFEHNLDLNDLAPQLYQIIDDYRENIYKTVSDNISNVKK